MTFLPPAPNVVLVPWTGFSPGGTQSTYFVRLGTPINLKGNAAEDWTIVAAADPNTASDRVKSDKREGYMWWADTCVQCGPEASQRRAFLSGFYDHLANQVGVTGCASGLINNNDREQISAAYGGMVLGTELFFQLAWNGNTPLTFNSGQIMLWSS